MTKTVAKKAKTVGTKTLTKKVVKTTVRRTTKAPAKKVASKEPQLSSWQLANIPKELPPNTERADFIAPSYDDTKNALDYTAGEHGKLTLYNVASFGWVIATLGISRGKAGRADRTYGTRLIGGEVVRVGNGPHVLQTVELYIREHRKVALGDYLERYTQGAIAASTIRDRISTRRAQGVLRRSTQRSWF